MKRFCLLVMLCAILPVSCRGLKKEAAIINTPTQSGTIGSIDIPAPGYFYMLRPWKNGTLVTMDGQARFAELSFVGDSQIRITPLIDFPRERIDPGLTVAPESGLCIVRMRGGYYIANISTGKTKYLSPVSSWRFGDGRVRILDSINGIVVFAYSASEYDFVNTMPYYNVIYDTKNDRVLYESPKGGEDVILYFSFTSNLCLSEKRNADRLREYVFFNWRTRETIRNDLTEKLNIIGTTVLFDANCNINFEERYMFINLPLSREESEPRKVKMTWDEDYEHVKVIPLDYLVPEDKRVSDFFLSTDGKWATTFVGDYRGLYGELLDKRVFFHLDGRYPNGLSMPIFIDDYVEFHWDWGSFVEHPVHGMCFAEEWYRNDDGENKQYLRLYKMDDVLAEINRQLLEKANGVVR